MRPINEILIHCSATAEGKDFDAHDIDRWHRERGWDGIGYHFVVLCNGEIESGRPIEKIGAHTRGHNADSIGICYIGGLARIGKEPKDTRTPIQKTALACLCKDLLKKYPSIKKISGHNEYAAKACPSFEVQTDPLLSEIMGALE
ncbi:MAG: hypothetical protein JSC189_001041 [Candidatus Tokpelaia sp. JSC189]|nr:MAG: hypothetical protein JSC189_001041 [Candidatus Tokpelaia sp. JSC189]